jgi:TRAP-type C4-dicarboxylate transport system substrate-binding protein
MMKKSLMLLFAVLVMLSLVVGGCASQPAPAPTTSAPATSAAPTTTAAPKTTAPATTSAPTTTAAPKQVFEMRFSHNLPPSGWTAAQFLYPWAKKVEAATNGAIKIVMYPAQSLATLADNYDATVSNLSQISWSATSPYQGRFSLTEVITLPFLSAATGTLNGQKVPGAVVSSRMVQELYDAMPELQKEWAQTKPLVFHTTDTHFLATQKPIKSLVDMKGVKIAVPGAGPGLEMWKKMGASPTYIPASSLYESAQKGVVDACAVNWGSLGTFRYYEIFSYGTEMSSFVTMFGLVMNLETWNKLPAEVQKQVMSVSGVTGAEFAGSTAFGFEASAAVQKQIKAVGKSFELVQLNEGEQDKMKAVAGKPIWDEWVTAMKARGLAGDKVLEAALKLAEKYK